jgi:hypothetical protein
MSRLGAFFAICNLFGRFSVEVKSSAAHQASSHSEAARGGGATSVCCSKMQKRRNLASNLMMRLHYNTYNSPCFLFYITTPNANLADFPDAAPPDRTLTRAPWRWPARRRPRRPSPPLPPKAVLYYVVELDECHYCTCILSGRSRRQSLSSALRRGRESCRAGLENGELHP